MVEVEEIVGAIRMEHKAMKILAAKYGIEVFPGESEDDLRQRIKFQINMLPIGVTMRDCEDHMRRTGYIIISPRHWLARLYRWLKSWTKQR